MFPRYRVQWVALLASIALSLMVSGATAETAGKPIRVGVLLSGSEAQWSQFEAALAEGLRQRGYIEGRNLTLILRYGELQATRIRSAAAELASMQVDAIVTSCTGTTKAVAGAAPGTPIVFASIGDPVLAGLVPSLARPGGNITGRMSLALEVIPKRLEMLQRVLPESNRSGSRIAVLMNATEPAHEAAWRAATNAARDLKLELVRVELNSPGKVDAALDALARAEAKGLLVFSDDPVVIENFGRIAAAANKLGLPSISGPRVYAEAGGLLSYGMDMRDDYRLSARYVVSIANGVNPGTLAVEQPLVPELTINMKTAAALNISIPRELILFAHKKIE